MLRFDEVKFSEALYDFVMLLPNNKVPSEFLPFLRGGKITALEKEDGSVRPVVPTEWPSRLLGRAICRARAAEISAGLVPLQLGVGVNDSASLMAQAVRRHLIANGDHVVLLVDIVNAFGSISRDAIRRSVVDMGFSWLLPTFDQLYGGHAAHSVPMSNGRVAQVAQVEGVNQGCPLGPVLFAVGLHPALKKASAAAEASGTSVFAYLDDGAIVGELDSVIAVFHVFVEAARKVGLEVNFAKTKVLMGEIGRAHV